MGFNSVVSEIIDVIKTNTNQWRVVIFQGLCPVEESPVFHKYRRCARVEAVSMAKNRFEDEWERHLNFPMRDHYNG